MTAGCPGNRETAAREWRLSCCGVDLGTYATREAAEARAAHLDSCTNGHAPQIVEWAPVAASLPVLPETREAALCAICGNPKKGHEYEEDFRPAVSVVELTLPEQSRPVETKDKT